MVGLEREFSDQPAGFRTHILVSLGAALFTLVGAYGVESFFSSGVSAARFDPTRVAAQVVTGIGFLGAGAIIRQGVTVRGLTTAAALWVTAAIGTAVALGYWIGAVATSAMTIIALYGLKRLERILFGRFRRGAYRFVIEMTPELRLSDVTRVVEAQEGRVRSLDIVEDDDARRLLVASVHLPANRSPEVLAHEMSGTEGVSDIDWSSDSR